MFVLCALVEFATVFGNGDANGLSLDFLNVRVGLPDASFSRWALRR